MLDFMFKFGYTKAARIILSQVVLVMKKEKSSKKNHLMKSSWNLGKTATMRVPMLLKDRLMEIARHIDDGGGIELNDHQKTDRTIKSDEIILSQDTVKDNQSETTTKKDLGSKDILSQDKIEKIIDILKNGVTPKKQGGVYNSSNANTLKKEVMKALAILEQING